MVSFNLGKLFKKSGPVTNITNINVFWRGSFHSLAGLKTEENTFKFNLPFTNTSEIPDLVKNVFKSTEPEPIRINEIKVDLPFQLLKTTPSLPLVVKGQEKIEMELTIKAPDQSYSGPMSIRLIAEESEKIKIGINKVTLLAKGKSVDVENSQMLMEIKKGQLFKNSIQMYKILGFGDEVKSVSANKPFKFVSSQPSLPFKIDSESGYIVEFYIKAPDQGYSGPLELTLS